MARAMLHIKIPVNTPPLSPAPDGHKAAGNDLRNLEKVRGIFASLVKFVNAQAIYQSNNPHFIKSAEAFDRSFRSYFETENELLLTVSQYQLVWREQVVYDIGCNTESIAFLLYKDGIGELSIQSTVQRAELEQLAGILKGALFNPSAQFDTATALWHAEFPNIFYRVLDEQADVGDGTGDGSGSNGREQPLRANDHQDLPGNEATRGAARHQDSSLETLGSYFNALANGDSPGAHEQDREQCLQQTIAQQLTMEAHAISQWAAARTADDDDTLISFLRVMLDFTRAHCAPPVVRDVTDTIERLVHYIRDEGSVPTLVAALELKTRLDATPIEPAFASLPGRIEAELTDSAYLISLVKAPRPGNGHGEILRYLRLVGPKAVNALCELLAMSTDSAIHDETCDLLLGIVPGDIATIVEGLDIENPFLAGDAVYLLSRAAPAVIPPVIHRIHACRDAKIRRRAIEYLVGIASEESARLLCALLKDEDPGVRIRTLACVDRLPHPLIVNEVTSLCFAEQSMLRTTEELEQMFRALGRLAGANALPRIKQVVEKKHLLSVNRNRGKREKLLAITALRYIAGDEARGILEKLSRDSDQLVKTKALHVLKRAPGSESPSGEMDLVGADAQEDPA